MPDLRHRIADDRLIFTRAQDRKVFTVDIDPGPPFRIRAPRPLGLVTLPKDVMGFDALDKSRILITRPVAKAAPSLTVVLNWTEGLRR